MMEFETPRIVISKCIEFEHCRWNGMIISSDVVKLLKPYVEFIPVCPEVGIGLGVPREPVRIVEVDGTPQLYQPATDTYWTEAMRAFASQTLDGLPEVDGFLLKGRSPTCGLKDVKVYPDRPKAMPANKGVGLFAAAVLERYPQLAVEDEGRLTNFAIREHFLTRIFTWAALRRTRAVGTMGALVQFHAQNKLLLMAYHQSEMRTLGRIVANHDGQPVEAVYAAYAEHLSAALKHPARYTASINVLMHAMGYFSEGLLSSEKAFFLECLEDYRAGRAPLSVPTSILRSWIVRFGQAYLAQQTFFEPYPEGLVAITDSGKGRSI
ncbi:MAG: DUF1722 domain-containing protein [Anaerolineae bacterium]|nr:DUF1722 domain-containing protein [Anaerolineae bacterium]